MVRHQWLEARCKGPMFCCYYNSKHYGCLWSKGIENEEDTGA